SWRGGRANRECGAAGRQHALASRFHFTITPPVPRPRVRARFSAIILVTPAACALLARIAARRICVFGSEKLATQPQRSSRRTRSAARGKYRQPIPGDGTARHGRRADDPRDAAAIAASDRRDHINGAGSRGAGGGGYVFSR